MFRIYFTTILLFCFSFASLFSQSLKKEKQFSEHKVLPFYHFSKKSNTHLFQGNRKKKNYFEGWYFKMVSEDGKSIMSVIPGISLSENGEDQHAFIQLINGITAKTYYFSFPIEDFHFSRSEFSIRIGENYFSEDSLVLNLNDDGERIVGKVIMSNQTPYQIKKRNPAIMGWYRFVPFMQCYHGVVSLTHRLDGVIKVNNTPHSFEKGKGYIEKDWGEGMPKAWIWMQSNHFSNSNTSFMLSVATIPWLGKSFTGFLGFLYYEHKVVRFATYTKADLEIKMDADNTLYIKIQNGKQSIVLKAKTSNAGVLKAPVNGSMDRRIAESIDASLTISVRDSDENIIYTDSSKITGLEMVGDIKKLVESIK